jgi:hypothetical protein
VKARLLDRHLGYLVALGGIGSVTALLRLAALASEHVNATTVALALLLTVLFIATRWGSGPGYCARHRRSARRQHLVRGWSGTRAHFTVPIGADEEAENA